jgi:eukaryotic-like serine/threonine-protein kinase
MVARSIDCDVDALRLLLAERLPERRHAALEAHLEVCPSCRDELERMAGESQDWGDLRLLDLSPPAEKGGFGETIGDPVGERRAAVRKLDFLVPPRDPAHLGRIGNYDVLEILGQGGNGVVFKALDAALNRVVAIKTLAPWLASSESARLRFAREARAAAAIVHEHIVAIHAVATTPDGLPYFVMSFIAGKTLQERIEADGALGAREILRIGMQAAAGLAAAHAVGLVHRDVKPANILLENCIERVKLTDFGLARAMDDASLTLSGVVAGTPLFMSPEQARGEAVDHRSDLFSLGSVLYALCTGRAPFRAETMMGILRRVSDESPRPIREINPEIPTWLAALIDKMLAKSPADRFSSASEVADLLGKGLAYLEQPGSGSPPFPVSQSPRHQRRWIAAAAVALIGLAGLGVSEASGVTQVADYVSTVLRIKTPSGTLVVKVDDPAVKVKIDGKDLLLTGVGPEEVRIRLEPGEHQVLATKDGKPVLDRVITLSRGDKELVTVGWEAGTSANLHDVTTTKAPTSGAASAEPKVAMTDSAVFSAAATPDGKSVAVALYEKSVVLLDQRTLQVKLSLRGHQMPVRSVAISPDGKMLASASGDYRENTRPGEVMLWDLKTGRKLADLNGHTAMVWSVAFSPDGRTLATAGWDNEARLWDVGTRLATGVLKGHTDAVRTLAFSPDGSTLVTSGFDGELKFWHVAPNRSYHAQLWSNHTAYKAGVSCVAFSPDGHTLAISARPNAEPDHPGEVMLLDISTWKEVARLRGHQEGVISVCFSPDGKMLATGGGRLADSEARGEVLLWESATGKMLARFNDPRFVVETLVFTPDGKALVAGGGVRDEGGEIRIWPIHSLGVPVHADALERTTLDVMGLPPIVKP